MSALDSEPAATADWERRLGDIMRMMRETSQHSDPQAMVAAYGRHVMSMNPVDGFVAISRRDLDSPKFRVTRHSGWTENINPWQQRDRLPILAGGLLGKLLYDGEPRIIDDVVLDDGDPAAEYLGDHRSLMAVPHLERGEAVNMFVSLRKAPAAFDKREISRTRSGRRSSLAARRTTWCWPSRSARRTTWSIASCKSWATSSGRCCHRNCPTCRA